MKNLMIILSIMTVLAMSCQNEKKTTTDTADAPEETSTASTAIATQEYITSLGWSGIYTGVVPCPEAMGEDCSGQRYNIELRGDNTYKSISYYTHQPADRTTVEGQITWDDSGSRIDLVSEGAVVKFKVAEGYIVKLADDGTDLGNENIYRLTKL